MPQKKESLLPLDPTLLPLDPALLFGKLDNSIRYYVKENLKPASTVELRLVVRVGSMAEASIYLKYSFDHK